MEAAMRTAARPASVVGGLLRDVVRSREDLIAENTLLRQQLIVAARAVRKPSFPAEDGGFRSDRFLTKAFAEARQLTGVRKRFTPRGMRRTFNDLARLANVEAVITKSISGHKTERMREHYSSVQPSEQRESIDRLLRLVKPAGTVSKHRDNGCSEGCSESPKGAPASERTASPNCLDSL
jgi:integrase